LYIKNDKNETLITCDKHGDIEEVQDVQTIVKVTKRHYKKGEFYMHTLALDELTLEKRYNITELRTLIALKIRLDYNNRIQSFRQVDIAEEIGSSQAQVSRAMKRIIGDGIVYISGRDYYFSDKYIKGAGDSKPKRNKTITKPTLLKKQ